MPEWASFFFNYFSKRFVSENENEKAENTDKNVQNDENVDKSTKHDKEMVENDKEMVENNEEMVENAEERVEKEEEMVENDELNQKEYLAQDLLFKASKENNKDLIKQEKYYLLPRF